MLGRIKREFAEGKTLLQFGALTATGQALLPLIVAKFFSPELFGQYSLAKMIMFFFLTLLVSSAQAPFIVFGNQEKAQSGRINKAFSVQLVFLVFSFFIFAMSTLFFGRFITAFAKISFVDLLFVASGFAGLALKTFLCNLFMAMGQRIKSSVAEVVFGVFSLILIFCFYAADRINLRTVFLIYPLSAAALIAVFSITIDYKMLFPFIVEGKYFREMFDYTKWIFLGSIAVYFAGWGDNFILRIFVTMKDIGTYNLAYQISKGVIGLVLILNSYFLPFVSENIGSAEKIRGYLSGKRPRIIITGFAGISLLFVIAPVIFRIVYGDVYRESVAVLRILLVAAASSLYIIFYEVILYALKRYKFIQAVNVIHVCVNLALDLILVPIMGFWGAAVATVCAYICRVITIEIYFRLKLVKELKL
jgi:O-antigen/teichoic acid export membrane protein